MTAEPIDLPAMKGEWLRALEEAETFIRNAPADEIGCLYYSKRSGAFVDPGPRPDQDDIVPHYGRPGGVLPRFHPGEPFPQG
jgi:hypothetical protein